MQVGVVQPRVIDYPVLVLVGPTGIGKTALTLELFAELDLEVVSMDSMQVYRYLDIGTAKPSPAERCRIRHHLLDIVDPDEQYDAACFTRDCVEAVEQIGKRGRLSLITGGTGLYLSTLLKGLFDTVHVADEIRGALREQLEEQGSAAMHRRLQQVDPVTAERVHVNDRQRILRGLELFEATGRPWSEHLSRQSGPPVRFTRMLQLGLWCEREELYAKINRRTTMMMEQGLLGEVEALVGRGYGCQLSSMQAIGYRHMCAYLRGEVSLEDAVSLLRRDTRRYAKRQLTWFRRMRGISWIPVSRPDEALKKWMEFKDLGLSS